ncbi:NACHT domain-containing protein [Nonomuraea sp. NPDC052265]|uniref:NACHT domain-containing protein n=1 Tax=Nonomuraea sp. NPDC052265 TaxID=3364374 RepID=UPI0037CA4040
MTYDEAVRLLGREDSALVNALDRALGLGLLVITGFNPNSALPYFDAKNELIAKLHQLTREVKDRIQKSSRIEYEKLLTAAHTVIVITAFTEELSERLRALDSDGQWSRELRQWQPQLGEQDFPDRRDRLVEWASQSVIMPPGPTRPFDVVIDEITAVYNRLGNQARRYLSGLARWDKLSETMRSEIRWELSSNLTRSAFDRYLEHYVRLAAQVPEFLAWTLLNEHSATRWTMRRLVLGLTAEQSELRAEFQASLSRIEAKIDSDLAALGDLPALLAEMAERRGEGAEELRERVAECHRVHRRVLQKPLLAPRDLESVRFPTNERGYINPNYKVAVTRRSDEGRTLAQEEWWENQPVQSGLGGFLAAFLRTEQATQVPLLVLGDPGSGKSLLSKILAAQLPPDEFAVARVELRHVHSSHEVSDQIDLELQRQTNNRYKLEDLTDPHGRITRVVITDGLDELLQLSSHEGLGRYLERLAEFQEIEAELGRPVIAIATARTIVMDRVYIPAHTTVVKMVGFDEDQISSWIEAWNAENVDHFAERHLEPLDPQTMEEYAELARQPLLLALLALYDAEENGLRNAGDMSQPELYERVFRRYLERELEKHDLPARPAERDQLVEQRFRELSTIATGMLNRGRRFITRQEVDRDFETIGVRRNPASSVMTRADDAVGQFFFLYRAQARHHESTLYEGYEFIHSTFGEFLSARIIARQLVRAAEIMRLAPAWEEVESLRHARSLLIPYLCPRALISEEQVLLFLEDIVGELVDDREAAALAIASHVRALMKAGMVAADGFDLAERSHLERLATLSVNLAVMALHVAEAELPLTAFCTDVQDWQRLTALWKSHLADDDWSRVLNSFVLGGSGSSVPTLSHRIHRIRETDLGSYVTMPHLALMIEEGRLVGDLHLQGAAAVWGLLWSQLGNESLDAGSEWLVAQAFFRVNPHTWRGGLGRALEVLEKGDPGDNDLLDLIVTGPGVWEDDILTGVAEHVAMRSELAFKALPLLRLISELDKRGYAALARRLLARLPMSESLEDLDPPGIAALVILSRRHQLRGVWSPIFGRLLTDSSAAIEWLGIEDLMWVFRSGDLSGAEQTALAMHLRSDPRLRRALADVIELTELLDSAIPPE